MARVATCAGNVVGCRSPRARRQVTDVPDLVHPTSDLLGALGAAPCRRHTGQPRLGFPQGYLKPRRRQIPQRRSAVRVEGNLSAGLTWCLDTDKSQLGRMYASHRPQQSTTPATRRSSLRRVTEPTPPPSQANQPPVLCCLGHWPSPPTLRRLNRCIWPPGQPFALPDQAGGQLVTRRRLLERCDPRDCMCSCMYVPKLPPLGRGSKTFRGICNHSWAVCPGPEWTANRFGQCDPLADPELAAKTQRRGCKGGVDELMPSWSLSICPSDVIGDSW